MGDALVAHTTPDWARAHLEEAKEAVTEALLAALPVEVEPIYAAAHRWRYSQTRTALGEPFVESEDGTLLCAGDWCLGPHAEHGWRSARAVVEALR